MKKLYSRQYIQEIINALKSENAIILIGTRQVGKTSIMKILDEHFKTEGKYTIFLDMEMPSNLRIFEEGVEGFIKYLQDYHSFSNTSPTTYVFLDEFHYIPNAGKILKVFVDHYKNLKLICSGSSSIELQKTLIESSVGRKRIIKILPLSFQEYLEFREAPENSMYSKMYIQDIPSTSVKDTMQRYFLEYLIWGGMPKVILQKEIKEKALILEEIVQSYLQKDIKALLGSENLIHFNKLLEIVAYETANIINVHSLGASCNLKRNQLEKLLYVAEQTFIMDMLPPYFSSKRKELSKAKKNIFYDNGIRNFIIRNFSPIEKREDSGRILETAVYNEIKHTITPFQDIYYWRTIHQTEIDFILKQNELLFPIEVKSHCKIVPKAILSFIEQNKNKCVGAFVLNVTEWKKENINGIDIYFIPHYCAALIPSFILQATN